jgi:hypothetical protein
MEAAMVETTGMDIQSPFLSREFLRQRFSPDAIDVSRANVQQAVLSDAYLIAQQGDDAHAIDATSAHQPSEALDFGREAASRGANNCTTQALQGSSWS